MNVIHEFDLYCEGVPAY